MKKLVAILLSFIMLIGFAACSANSQQTKSSSSDKSTSSSAATENSAAEKGSEKSTADNENSKILVAYFSATGTTKGVAQTLSEIVGADLYEITPQDPYTDADLNYNDSNSRSTVEMNDAKSRPAISGSVENMDDYDIIFIGYPIWWGDAPRIISTFLESYDFSGKTIVPFCTSGGSDISASSDNLAKLADKAKWLDGQRFDGSASQSEIEKWVDSIGLQNVGQDNK